MSEECKDIQIYRKDIKRQKITFDDIIQEYSLDNITTIKDLINIVVMFFDISIPNEVFVEIQYRLNYEALFSIIDSLIELDRMVGMEKLKKNMIDLIIFHLSGVAKSNKNMLHMVLYGEPGTGKSTVVEILAKIYKNMGVLSKGTVKSVKAPDLIGKYVGHTAVKTRDVLESCKGGILIIDEAYSLGRDRDRGSSDGFTKECIDEINRYLSECKEDFVCIIAGYKKEIEKCFFAYNSGLQRRFPFRFTIEPYSPKEMKEIFDIILSRELQWKLEKDDVITSQFFNKNKDMFKFYGGSIELFIHSIKIAHAKRAFILREEDRFTISKKDIEIGFACYVANNELNKNENERDNFLMLYQ